MDELEQFITDNDEMDGIEDFTFDGSDMLQIDGDV